MKMELADVVSDKLVIDGQKRFVEASTKFRQFPKVRRVSRFGHQPLDVVIAYAKFVDESGHVFEVVSASRNMKRERTGRVFKIDPLPLFVNFPQKTDGECIQQQKKEKGHDDLFHVRSSEENALWQKYNKRNERSFKNYWEASYAVDRFETFSAFFDDSVENSRRN
ncbi:hypothetical protein [Hydrogenimonas sp.]